MDKIGLLLIVAGILTLFVGLGIDTTRTASNCVTYESSFADGYSCVEYQYQNPLGKIVFITLGFGMALVGGWKAIYSKSKNTESKQATSSDQEKNRSSTSNSGDQSFADLLEENREE